MKWKREGCIAGLCDYVTVYLFGEVHRSLSKNGQSSEEHLTDDLPEAEIAKPDEWMQKYGTVTIDVSDSNGVSSSLIRTFEVGNSASLDIVFLRDAVRHSFTGYS